jgi:hypothetical protein
LAKSTNYEAAHYAVFSTLLLFKYSDTECKYIIHFLDRLWKAVSENNSAYRELVLQGKFKELENQR